MRPGAPPPARAVPTSVRQWNERVVVRAMGDAGPLRIAEIAARTGLTPPTLRQVLQGLADKNWVHVHASTTTGRGRPARLFSLHRPRAWVLGLDVGAHAIRGVRLRLDGTRETANERRLGPEASQDERHAAVAALVEELCAEADRDEIWLSGLAVGGSLSADGTVQRSVAIPHWEGLRPLDLFADVIPSQGLLVNDVFAATLAEHVAGATRGLNEILYVHLGRRPTFGIFVAGDVHRGAHGTAGDMSRSPLLTGEEGHPWMVRLVDAPSTAVTLQPAAGVGGVDDALADSIRSYVASITPTLALAASLVDPEVMVIAGALAPHAGLFIDDLQTALGQQVRSAPRVVTTEFDQFASAIGAAQLALRELDRRLVNEERGVAVLHKASVSGPGH